MAETKKAAAEDKAGHADGHSKKETRKLIEKKLETALANLKPQLGDKKFKSRIKKAGKLLAHGLKTNGVVEKTPKPKTAKSADTVKKGADTANKKASV